MKKIPDNSVDLVCTDPPYKLTSGGCGGSLNIVFNTVSKAAMSRGQFFNIPLFKDWINQVYRVLKNGSHFYCMINDKNLRDLLNVATEAGFKELNVLVWNKGMHTPTGYYMKNVEFIVLFRKGIAKKINNQGSMALINIRGVYGNKTHPSEKPIKLMEYLICNSTNEGDSVLDPFMGSGTTAIACINTKRNFIGFELDKEYHDLSNRRIKERELKLSL